MGVAACVADAVIAVFQSCMTINDESDMQPNLVIQAESVQALRRRLAQVVNVCIQPVLTTFIAQHA